MDNSLEFMDAIQDFARASSRIEKAANAIANDATGKYSEEEKEMIAKDVKKMDVQKTMKDMIKDIDLDSLRNVQNNI